MLRTCENELIERLYARDQAAMTEFYDQYGKVLYSVILRIVRNEELAEDALQECMVKIWYSFASYDPGRGRLFTWALNVCRHAAIDQLRTRRYRESQSTQPLEGSKALRTPALAAFLPEHVGVRELLLLLKPADRVLMELLYFGGFTHSEAADELQLPLGTVKTRVRASIQLLSRAAQEPLDFAALPVRG
ncbi:sigma-70 family RNA polymerase sigma factor [Hymenobacter sp. BT175]|uniref:RNA polymerase sigma factor n=1 Tax=Hymenobacter translucens TaxID=2886507 RepID=UPI001D0ED9A9|nr:sigma-70 family RNA polymerase sigma factor [Hymenobacter translucens]MCC2545339.1 sigma-70 family RNA polymerase sigma factor [Hymenobacter translucens]